MNDYGNVLGSIIGEEAQYVEKSMLDMHPDQRKLKVFSSALSRLSQDPGEIIRMSGLSGNPERLSTGGKPALK